MIEVYLQRQQKVYEQKKKTLSFQIKMPIAGDWPLSTRIEFQ